MYAWFLLCEKNGIDIHELGNLPHEKMFSDLIYSAACSYLKDKGKKLKFTQEQLDGWIDKMNHKDSASLGDAIMKSKVFGKSVEDYAKDARVKKK